MKTNFLLWLSKGWKKNDDKDYPQTWYYMPKKEIFPMDTNISSIFVWLIWRAMNCPKTEWGYGGGDCADRWCRWCDKRVEVPKQSIYFQFKESNPKELMTGVGE